MQDDAILVAQASTGNKEAFGELITRYEKVAWQFATRLLGDPHLAQEVLQEAMLEAYLSLSKLHEATRFRGWFYGIILNLSRNYWRGQKLSYLSLEGDPAIDTIEFRATDPEPETIAEARELHQIVLAAVQSLSPANRAAVMLFYYDDLSMAEIAAVLGISLTAVKGRLHKSRNELKSSLLSALDPEVGRQIVSKERNRAMVEVQLLDVVPPQDDKPHYVVVLEDKAGQRILPIWIGAQEGIAIGIGLRKLLVARPLTYDFMSKLLSATGATLEEVRIEQLKDLTFFAVAKLRTGQTVQEIDARPSDALALAVQVGCPIRVAEAVFEAAGVPIPADAKPDNGKGLDQIAEKVKEDQLQWRNAAASPLNPATLAESQQALVSHLFG